MKTEDSAVGFYALHGESVVTFTEDEMKERICEVLALVREQNPRQRILLVMDKHGAHICEYTRKRANQLGIDLVFLPLGSPHLNPIEKVWDQLKWTTSPIIVQNEQEFFELVKARISKHRGTDPAAEFFPDFKEKPRVSDAEFLVDGMGYLTALARTSLSGDLNYTDRNIVEKLFQTFTMRIGRFHETWNGSQASASGG